MIILILTCTERLENFVRSPATQEDQVERHGPLAEEFMDYLLTERSERTSCP